MWPFKDEDEEKWNRHLLYRIVEQQRRVTKKQEIVMAAIDDLNAAVAKLSTDVNTLLSGVTPNSAVVATTAAINAIDTTVVAAITPPPAPAP